MFPVRIWELFICSECGWNLFETFVSPPETVKVQRSCENIHQTCRHRKTLKYRSFFNCVPSTVCSVHFISRDFLSSLLPQKKKKKRLFWIVYLPSSVLKLFGSQFRHHKLSRETSPFLGRFYRFCWHCRSGKVSLQSDLSCRGRRSEQKSWLFFFQGLIRLYWRAVNDITLLQLLFPTGGCLMAAK